MHEREVEDPELAGDIVGVASARLLAAGVPAPRRLTALRLLGVLGSVADAALVVRRPVADLAREFGLDPRQAAAALDDLASVAVVRRDGDRIVVGGAEPPAAGGLRLQDFLALADDLDEHRHRRRAAIVVLRPAVAALAAAALIAAVFLVPMARRQPTTPVSSHGSTARSSSTTLVPTPVPPPSTARAHAGTTLDSRRASGTKPPAGVGGASPAPGPGITLPGAPPTLPPTASSVPLTVPSGADVPGAISGPQGQDGPNPCPPG